MMSDGATRAVAGAASPSRGRGPLGEASGPTRVSLPVRLGYGLGAVGSGACLQVTTVLLLRFLTDDLGISAALAGLLLGLLQIYEGVLNPVVGIASDNSRNRFGRRLPYLFAGVLLLPLSVWLLFSMPKLAGSGETILLLAGVLALFGAAYTIWTVPFIAMGAEMTDDYHERSVIMSWRNYGGAAGVMLGSTLPAWLLVVWGGGRSAHAKMGLAIGLLGLSTGMVAGLLLRRAAATRRPEGGRAPLLRQLAIMWGNRPFRTIAVSHIVFLFGVATVSASNAFFSRYVLGRTDLWLGTFYVILLAGNVVANPFWVWLSKRIDKKATYVWSMSAYGLLHLTWLAAGPGEPNPVLVGRVFLIGFAMSGVVLMGYSMLADATRYDFVKSGTRLEGAFSGVNSLVERCSAALGIAAMGLILGATGYRSSLHGTIHQGGAVIWGLYATFSIIPAVTALLSLLFMTGYKLRQEDLGDGLGPVVPSPDLRILPGLLPATESLGLAP